MAPISTIFFFILDSLNFLFTPVPPSSHHLASNPNRQAFSPIGDDVFLHGFSV
ncbi:hypothetical protein SLEP1_g5545 [Rubroshorea leprosula]|uniref:Uncharacterized protein n=1 Tax=Rubroshorea leprosula TaxID=152421 RepID=A0AAV5HSA9_9ROSI|nr:hypothetical protein SLEP1_g5545 [Rubroshorea leprosula]